MVGKKKLMLRYAWSGYASARKMIIDFPTPSYTYVTVYICSTISWIVAVIHNCTISYIANTAIQIGYRLPSGFIISYIKTIGRDFVNTEFS